MRTHGTLMTAAAFGVFGIALADDKPAFSEADANDNGKVSIEEATEAGIPEDEAKLSDLDEDGRLTETDWKFVDMQPSDTGPSSS